MTESTDEYVRALTGRIATDRISPLYVLGLLIVAVAMVLLPLIYIALIFGVGYLLYLHLTRDLAIIAPGGGWFLRLLIFLTPVVIGLVLIYFMIKPLFLRTGRMGGSVELSEEEQPVLFAFVRQICESVGAAVPRRIDVDCQVNASAGFRRGLLSFLGNDLVLTVGTPLVRGLSLQQFAGVLAHEFGHFTQGGAMRLSYVIRSVNHWFARVVQGRESIDRSLDSAAREADWRIMIVLRCAQGGVFLTSKLLWSLMMLGHMISSFMMRQMEFDADKYEIRLAGSEAFTSTAMQLRVLGVASQISMNEAQIAWREGMLPENYAALTEACVARIPPEIRESLEKHVEERKTKWMDTHPSDKDRAARAARENTPGIFQEDAPASAIFLDFDAVCRKASKSYYTWMLGGQEPSADQLILTEDVLARHATDAELSETLRRYFVGTMSRYSPLIVGDTPDVPADRDALVDMLRNLREEAARSVQARGKVLTQLNETIEKCVRARLATAFLTAGFRIDLSVFGLEQGSLAEADRSYDEAKADQARLCAEMVDLDGVMRSRLQAAFMLLRDAGTGPDIESRDELVEEWGALSTALSKMGGVFEVTRMVVEFVKMQDVLFANFQENENNDKLRQAILDCAGDTHRELEGARTALFGVEGPFAAASRHRMLADFVLEKRPTADNVVAVHQAAHEYLERFSLTYARSVARLAKIAEMVEASVGLPPMVVEVVGEDSPEESAPDEPEGYWDM